MLWKDERASGGVKGETGQAWYTGGSSIFGAAEAWGRRQLEAIVRCCLCK